jgi:hypothetical protein
MGEGHQDGRDSASIAVGGWQLPVTFTCNRQTTSVQKKEDTKVSSLTFIINSSSSFFLFYFKRPPLFTLLVPDAPT